jgi:hypothetical protein
MAKLTLDLEEYRDPELLPAVCVVCGEAAEECADQKFSTSLLLWVLWLPIFLCLCQVIGLIFWTLVAFTNGRTVQLQLPVCEEHRNYFLIRTWMSRLWKLCSFGSAAAGITTTYLLHEFRLNQAKSIGLYSLLTGGAGLIFFTLVNYFYLVTGVRVTSISDSDVILDKTHPRFQHELEILREETGRDPKTGRKLGSGVAEDLPSCDSPKSSTHAEE